MNSLFCNSKRWFLLKCKWINNGVIWRCFSLVLTKFIINDHNMLLILFCLAFLCLVLFWIGRSYFNILNIHCKHTFLISIQSKHYCRVLRKLYILYQESVCWIAMQTRHIKTLKTINDRHHNIVEWYFCI